MIPRTLPFPKFRLLTVVLLATLAVRWPTARAAGDPPPHPFLERQIKLDHRYLNVPVKAGAPRRTLSLIVDGRVVRATEVELAEGEPEFWAFTEVENWLGKNATLRLDQVGQIGKPETQKLALERPIGPRALDAIHVADDLADAASLYHEPHRPQFHFTTRRGWLNDPNGLLYDQGEYQLFYQYQPFSMSSLNGDKSWAHAVSRDLVHWEEVPVAVHPDENGGAWSGSTLVDTHNVAGFQSGRDPAWLLFYTSTGRSAVNPKPADPADFEQRLAYSNDRGRTWTMFAGNPIMKNITPYNRDPVVFWHEPSKRWVMVLYVGYPVSSPGNLYTAQIFNSENLKDWTYQSRIEGFFDCPVLFELPLDGNKQDTRWIIHCANMKYRVGRFDGKVFAPETELIDSHKGKVGESAYAPQIFRNMPDARAVQLGWIYNEQPGSRQIMSFPTDLALVTTASGPRLRWQPVPEITKLYGARTTRRDLPLVADQRAVVLGRGRHLDVQAQIDVGKAREVEINLRGIPMVYHAVAKELTVRGYALPMVVKDDKLQLRVLLDETSLELFGDGGLVYLPLTIPPSEQEAVVCAAVRGGDARIESLDIIEINSIWPAHTPAAKISK